MMTEQTPGAAATTVGGYLSARLQQLGVDHLFGLPGDFNLALLDEVLADGHLEWVGSTNELNAAYAADGYARQRGFGALVTTFGVGELSALNGVAGAFAENVPLVQITGAPSTTTAAAGALVHHSLLDGDLGHFARVYGEVCAATEVLAAPTAAEQVDRALTAALDELRPVYLSVPTDVAVAAVPDAAARLQVPLHRRTSDPTALAALREALAERLRGTEPVLLAGHLAVRRRLGARLQVLAGAGRAEVATLLSAKGLVGEATPGSLGCYVGRLTPRAATRARVEGARDLVLVGAALSDLVTGMFSHHLHPAVHLHLHSAEVGDRRFDGVELDDAVTALGAVLADQPTDQPTALAASRPLPSDPAGAAGGPLTQAELWRHLQAWLPAGTPLLADAGTCYFGAAGLLLPAGAQLIGQPVWSSIGYALPATLGVALGAGPAAGPTGPGSRPPRPVLLIGDGAAQLSAQELSTLVRRQVPAVVVLVDNAGYTVERAIRSPDAVYQDVGAWDWAGLARALAPGCPLVTATASTAEGLLAALAAADRWDGPVLLHLLLGRDDVPDLLAGVARGLGAAPAPVP